MAAFIQLCCGGCSMRLHSARLHSAASSRSVSKCWSMVGGDGGGAALLLLLLMLLLLLLLLRMRWAGTDIAIDFAMHGCSSVSAPCSTVRWPVDRRLF